MSNRWKMNRMGFVNFWLYDNEIFEFENGKILIRGTNGSGKSITTQSIVSFILDGNRNPDRLDTFGSKDRKMEYYFLGDGDKEDETGYIFLELKKEQAEQYLTIGIGQRARKSKAMDFWGFLISDGKRIGNDINLFREIGTKRMPLSKNELERALGEKNKIVYKPKEYMEMINKELFGFSDIDYYNKLIKFLLKIRTSKLSTDIKPGNVHEILNDSLQILEEIDLRPLVDSLEKMDNMQEINEKQKEARKSLLTIKKEYDKYNKIILFKKAEAYFEAVKNYDNLDKTIKNLTKEIENLTKENEENNLLKENIERRLDEIQEESRLLKNKDLEKSVAELTLKEKERTERKNEIVLNSEKIEEYRNNLKRKESDKKNENRKKTNIENQLKQQYNEMTEINQVLKFDRHFKDENEIFDFRLYDEIKNNAEMFKENIKSGLEMLNTFEALSEKTEKQEEELYLCRRKKEKAEEEFSTAEKIEGQARENIIEQFYILKERNEFLKISKNELEKIIETIKKYDGLIHAEEIKTILEKNYNNQNSEFSQKKIELNVYKQQKEKELEKELTLLEFLKNKKESIPERSEEVLQCREELRKNGIKFMSFYEAVDFADSLSEQEKNRLESQLKESQILDSLIIPYSEQEKAQEIIKKYSDIILNTQKLPEETSVFKKLILENIDSEMKEIIINFLNKISTEETENPDYFILKNDGYFRNGVLKGYCSDKYTAAYIGVQRRKEKLQNDILEQENRCKIIQSEIENIIAFINEIEMKINVLKSEYNNIPKYTDLNTSIKLKKDAEYNLEKITVEFNEKERLLNELKKEYKEQEHKIIIHCKILPFKRRTEEYKEAERNIKEYLHLLYELERLLRDFQLSKIEIVRIEESEENEERLVEFYYDKLKEVEKELKKLENIIIKLNEIIHNPENIAAAEKLKKLSEEHLMLNSKKEEVNRKLTQEEIFLFNNKNSLKEHLEKERETENIVKITLKYLNEELDLKYVFKNNEKPEEIFKILSTEKKIKESSIVSAGISLNNIFTKNSGNLYEYMADIEEIFESDMQYCRKRSYIRMIREGQKLSLYEFEIVLNEEIERREFAIEEEDRKLIVDVLSGNIGHKLNDYIFESRKWIKEMSKIMQEMETSMKMKFFMEWKAKEKINESELEVNELEKLLNKSNKLLSGTDLEKISQHFKSKLNLIKEEMKDKDNELGYLDSIKRILDYREWFEFKLYYQRYGESKKELTNSAFNRFSGGEKAMSIYIPLLAAASAQYKKAKEDCPRIIALDEAFAGIDDKNISSMFELIDKLDFDYIMNSQILWGCYDTVKNLRIAELINQRDQKIITVNKFFWDGNKKYFEI